jgi:hypothetical protein
MSWPPLAVDVRPPAEMVSASYALRLACHCAGCGYPFDDVDRVKNGRRLSSRVTENGDREYVIEAFKACPRCLSYRVRVTLGVDG